MNYQNFIENVKEHFSHTLGMKAKICPVLKNNGMVYHGLVIQDPILNVSPMIYLHPFFSRYLTGIALETIYEEILETYQNHVPEDDFDVAPFCEFENAKSQIVMKLINTNRNTDLLEQVPHIPFYDLTIVFLYIVSDFSDEYATILIHNSHLQMWNTSVDELYKYAKDNSYRLLPPHLDNLHDIFEMITSESLDFLNDLNIFILTNYRRIHGASCMAYPGLLEELSQLYDDDLIILPSSIHDVLVFPKSNLPEKYTLSYFEEMIQEVNEKQLKDVEILSDHPYWYHRDTKGISY